MKPVACIKANIHNFLNIASLELYKKHYFRGCVKAWCLFKGAKENAKLLFQKDFNVIASKDRRNNLSFSTAKMMLSTA